ncbi:MAG: 5-formyltetrahydrofolate cyclo-ligase [Thermofilaceae archaeon]
MEEVRRQKEEIRRRVWRLLREKGVARPPFPIEGRIPNFAGAEAAAALLVRSRAFQKAEVVFCNPDSPQRPVREAALHYGKMVVMASPRLRSGFLVLNPSKIPRSAYREASTIAGAFKYGSQTLDKLPQIDLKVAGSVAVSAEGGRVGKGGGFSDLEYAILRELYRRRGPDRNDSPRPADRRADPDAEARCPRRPHLHPQGPNRSERAAKEA